jgi:peptide-methionine (S)-S-oxide reductase
MKANASNCLPADRTQEEKQMTTEIATFGAGCFWGVEAAFSKVPGVIEAVSGYSGGRTENPTYKDVCTDETGHAEVVQVTFDPAKVSFERLLEVFWGIHDPTQVNRQGPDFGSQYRTAIFFHTPEQEATAKKVKAELNASGKFKRPIATEITAAGPFYRAEEYHQKYFEKRGATSCHF